ncbi:MAG: nuclear transport factor 2 family protein [Acidobacteria bacterium]|nr:nuclear transport factor 2 family protein [Acidobacteriota bacterium]
MLRGPFRALLAVFAFLASAGPAEGRSAAPEADRAIEKFQKAFAEGDEAALRELLTEGFTRIDGGRVLDVPATLTLARENAAPRPVARRVSDSQTRRKQNTAWTRYRVTMVMTGPSGTDVVTLHETAVLVYKDAAWRLDLMTSVPARGTPESP